jgi:hypothetical protein
VDRSREDAEIPSWVPSRCAADVCWLGVAAAAAERYSRPAAAAGAPCGGLGEQLRLDVGLQLAGLQMGHVFVAGHDNDDSCQSPQNEGKTVWNILLPHTPPTLDILLSHLPSEM